MNRERKMHKPLDRFARAVKNQMIYEISSAGDKRKCVPFQIPSALADRAAAYRGIDSVVSAPRRPANNACDITCYVTYTANTRAPTAVEPGGHVGPTMVSLRKTYLLAYLLSIACNGIAVRLESSQRDGSNAYEYARDSV
jgi:hypothetical protein